jgi:hypothetical protein
MRALLPASLQHALSTIYLGYLAWREPLRHPMVPPFLVLPSTLPMGLRNVKRLRCVHLGTCAAIELHRIIAISFFVGDHCAWMAGENIRTQQFFGHLSSCATCERSCLAGFKDMKVARELV